MLAVGIVLELCKLGVLWQLPYTRSQKTVAKRLYPGYPGYWEKFPEVLKNVEHF